jgi:hypothetical protein
MSIIKNSQIISTLQHDAPEAYQQLSSQLREIYTEREASNIADLVIEHLSRAEKN